MTKRFHDHFVYELLIQPRSASSPQKQARKSSFSIITIRPMLPTAQPLLAA